MLQEGERFEVPMSDVIDTHYLSLAISNKQVLTPQPPSILRRSLASNRYRRAADRLANPSPSCPRCVTRPVTGALPLVQAWAAEDADAVD